MNRGDDLTCLLLNTTSTLHPCAHADTHTHSSHFYWSLFYSAWSPPPHPSLHASLPSTPPPLHLLSPPTGCYGPASTTLVSRIRCHTPHLDWLPAVKGWAYKKGREGREEKGEKKGKKRAILVLRWMAEAAQLQAEQRAPF